MTYFLFDGFIYPNLLVSRDDFEAYETICANPHGYYELVILNSDGEVEFVKEIDAEKISIFTSLEAAQQSVQLTGGEACPICHLPETYHILRDDGSSECPASN